MSEESVDEKSVACWNCLSECTCGEAEVPKSWVIARVGSFVVEDGGRVILREGECESGPCWDCIGEVVEHEGVVGDCIDFCVGGQHDEVLSCCGGEDGEEENQFDDVVGGR